MSNQMNLSVIPAERFVTEPYKIVLTGAPAGAQITIDATLTDETGQAWSSRGIYLSDLEGTVDTSKNASLFGTYRGIDAEALIWSMQPATLSDLEAAGANMDRIDSPRRTPSFDKFDAAVEDRKDPVKITLTARVTGDLAATNPGSIGTSHTVHFMSPDLNRIVVDDGDLAGVIYEGSGEGPHPIAMLVTGSDGGCYEARAALMASLGITTFALAHFNYPGKPDDHHNIPLEYFSQAMDWFGKRYDRERVAIFGSSRGGEAVLLIASYFPDQVSGVVADVPGNIVYAGVVISTLEAVPGWLLNGKPLPYVTTGNYTVRESDIYGASREVIQNFRAPIMGLANDDPRTIKIENIDCPIMFVSGTADTMWPGSLASQRMIQRLKDNEFNHEIIHLDYEGAGHMVSFPMIVKSRANETDINEMLGYSISIGGTPEGNAHAQSDAFPKILDFIRKVNA